MPTPLGEEEPHVQRRLKVEAGLISQSVMWWVLNKKLEQSPLGLKKVKFYNRMDVGNIFMLKEHKGGTINHLGERTTPTPKSKVPKVPNAQ